MADYQGANINVNFHLSNEKINLSKFEDKSKVYQSDAGALIDASRAVKQHALFGNIDPSELAKKYPFKPFDYQIQNVKTMLNRFDGRGVFGDQVGLGKTVEALMTAHTLFESGTIRNALIVVPAMTVDGWRNEIKNKFKGIFSDYYVASDTDSSSLSRLEKTLKRISDDNEDKSKKGFRVYIITDDMLRENSGNFRDQAHAQNIRRITIARPLDEDDMEALAAIREKLFADISLFNFLPKRILESFGWGKDKGTLLLTKSRLSCLVCRQVRDMLIELHEKYLEKFTRKESIAQKVLSEIKELITAFDLEYQTLDVEAHKENILTRLADQGEKQLIDLLIVDEVHTFYEKNPYEQSYDTAEASQWRASAIDFLSEIQKTYCVLVSATPVRTRLEDIFDLVRIADQDRFGADKKEAEAFFYKTICGVDPSDPHKLAHMISDSDKRSMFFGLVNNYFTRRRISEVSDDMKGSADVAFASLPKDHQAYIEKLSAEILAKRTLMYMQTGYNKADAESMVEDEFRLWKEGGLHKKSDTYRHMRAAIDAVLMKHALDQSLSREERRTAHALADWRRRGKRGILLNIPTSKGKTPSDKLMTEILEIDNTLERLHTDLYDANSEGDEAQLSNLLDTIYAEEIEKATTINEKGEKAFNISNDFSRPMHNDAVICYVRSYTFGQTKNIHHDIRRALEEKLRSAGSRVITTEPEKVSSLATSSEIDDIMLENHNQIALVGRQYQAGVNLQQYRTLIFSQMDWNGKRLLEPVDIEQWIGRIHRTGQIKNCRIITLPSAYLDTNGNVGQPFADPSFLRWYYTLLSDTEGLDLYGNTTPDIAFLQPVIVDLLKDCFDDKENTELQEKLHKALGNMKLPLTHPKDPQTFNFAQLTELCYQIDRLDGTDNCRCAIQNWIRGYSHMDGFGKPQL